MNVRPWVSVALPILLATCRYAFPVPRAVEPPPYRVQVVEQVAGEAGWRSKRIPMTHHEWLQRPVPQPV